MALHLQDSISHIENKEFTEGILIDLDYRRVTINDEETAELVLYTRDKERNRNRIFITYYNPYIYVKCKNRDIDKIISENQEFENWVIKFHKETKIEYESGKSINLIKLIGKQPWSVPKIRNILKQYNIPYFEADIPFTHRFMIDTNLKGLVGIQIDNKQKLTNMKEIEFSPRVLSIDIEIESSEDEGNSFERMIDQATKRITAIGLAWNEDGIKSKIFVLKNKSTDSEKKLIQDVLNYIWTKIDPDVIVTYNGDKFDIPYILNRMEELGISKQKFSPYGDNSPIPPAYGNGWRIPGVLIYDLYKKTTWLYTDDGRKTLDSVADKLLGETKIELDIDHAEIWRNSLSSDVDRRKFKNYVRRDVELTYKLWNVMEMSEWLEVIKICGAPPGEAMYFTERQAGEFLVFQIMAKNDVLIPPAPTIKERKERRRTRVSAPGGLVLEPKRDLASNVLICDFTSMYPSIMVAFNVGAESFKGLEGSPRERFRDEPQTTMSKMQEQMLNKRVEVKERLKQEKLNQEQRNKLKAYNWALKIVANSTFGSYNYIGSRFYNHEIARSITGIGRNYLSDLSKKVEEFGEGYETIYGDTDSVFIETPLADKIERLWQTPKDKVTEFNKLVPEVYQLLDFLGKMLPSEMRLELEDIAYRIIFHRGAKKRYAYLSAISKQISIYGFEAIRHDWSPFAKNVQRKVFDLILESGDVEFTKKRIIEYIQDEINVTGSELKNKVITFGPIKRHPIDYKSRTPAVQAYLDYCSRKNLDHDSEWKNIDYFPYIITKGSANLHERAKHPEFVEPELIDKEYYIEEALRTINRFNLGISLDEAIGVEYMDLTEFFK